MSNLLIIKDNINNEDLFLENLNNVTTLNITNNNKITDEIFINFPNLEKLIMGNCTQIKGYYFDKLNLKELYMLNCVNIKNKYLKKAYALQTLDIRGCPQIKITTIKKLKNLKTIYIDESLDFEIWGEYAETNNILVHSL